MENKTHQQISSKGGKAGTGGAKRRHPSHYKAMAKIRWAAHNAKKKKLK